MASLFQDFPLPAIQDSQDYIRLVPANSEVEIPAVGEFVYCKSSDGSVLVEINGKTTEMEPGDFRKMGGQQAFRGVKLINRTDLDKSTVFVIGFGDYDRKIIQGDVSITPVVRRADGSTANDTRFDVCFGVSVADTATEERAFSSIIEQRDAGLSGSYFSMMDTPTGILIASRDNSDGTNNVVTVQAYDSKDFDYLETQNIEWDPNERIHNPYFKYSEYFGCVVGKCSNGGTGLTYWAENLCQLFDTNLRPLGLPFYLGGAGYNRAFIQGDFRVTDNGLIEVYRAQSGQPLIVERFTLGGQLVETITTRLEYVYPPVALNDSKLYMVAIWLDGVNARRVYELDENYGVVQEIDDSTFFVGAISSGDTFRANYRPKTKTVVHFARSTGDIIESSLEDYIIQGSLVVLDGGGRVVIPEPVAVFSDVRISKLGRQNWMIAGEVIRSLLDTYSLNRGLRQVGDDYLDHVFAIDIDNGERKESGGSSFLAAGIEDYFTLKLPATVRLKIDNDMPRG